MNVPVRASTSRFGQLIRSSRLQVVLPFRDAQNIVLLHVRSLLCCVVLSAERWSSHCTSSIQFDSLSWLQLLLYFSGHGVRMRGHQFAIGKDSKSCQHQQVLCASSDQSAQQQCYHLADGCMWGWSTCSLCNRRRFSPEASNEWGQQHR